MPTGQPQPRDRRGWLQAAATPAYSLIHVLHPLDPLYPIATLTSLCTLRIPHCLFVCLAFLIALQPFQHPLHSLHPLHPQLTESLMSAASFVSPAACCVTCISCTPSALTPCSPWPLHTTPSQAHTLLSHPRSFLVLKPCAVSWEPLHQPAQSLSSRSRGSSSCPLPRLPSPWGDIDLSPHLKQT